MLAWKGQRARRNVLIQFFEDLIVKLCVKWVDSLVLIKKKFTILLPIS